MPDRARSLKRAAGDALYFGGRYPCLGDSGLARFRNGLLPPPSLHDTRVYGFIQTFGQHPLTRGQTASPMTSVTAAFSLGVALQVTEDRTNTRSDSHNGGYTYQQLSHNEPPNQRP